MVLLSSDVPRWRLVGRIEVNLRRLVADVLVSRHGEQAWMAGLNADQRKRVEERFWEGQRRRIADVPDIEERLSGADIALLFEIVAAQWKSSFSQFFQQNRPLFDVQRDTLLRMRNALNHYRAEKLPTGEEDAALRPNFDTFAPSFLNNVLRALAARNLTAVDFKEDDSEEDREDPLTLHKRDYIFFVGREAEIRDLTRFLSEPTAVTVVLGIGGVGKTALCLETARRLYRAGLFDEVQYFTAKTGFVSTEQATNYPKAFTSCSELVSRIIDQLGDTDKKLPEGWSNEDYALSLLQEQKTLLIVDNFETIEDQAETSRFLWSVGPTVRVLVSSRTPPPMGGRFFYLDKMEKEPIAQIIKSECELKGKPNLIKFSDEKTMNDIYTAIGGIPLAAKLLVGLMAVRFKSLGTVLSDFKQVERNRLIDFCFAEIYAMALSQDAKHILKCLAVCGETVKAEELEAVSGLQGDRLADAIQNLSMTSLVHVDSSDEGVDTWSLLPLTRTFARSKLLEDPGLEDEIDRRRQGYQQEVEALRDPALSASGRRAMQLANNARISIKRGRTDDAVDKCKKAMEVNDKIPFVHLVYGMAEAERGNQLEARRILEAAHGRFPHEHAITHKLATIESKLGHYSEAMALYRQTITPNPTTTEEIVQLEYSLEGMAKNLEAWIKVLRQNQEFREVRKQTQAFIDLVDRQVKYPGSLPARVKNVIKRCRVAYATELSIDGDFAAAEAEFLQSLIESPIHGRDTWHNADMKRRLLHNLEKWHPVDQETRRERYEKLFARVVTKRPGDQSDR